MLNARTLALKLEFHLFKKEGALLQNLVPAKTQAALRRLLRAQYLLWDARHYHTWLARELRERSNRYVCAPEPGLLSLLTPVWDGTPLAYFQQLADSVIQQNASEAAEWVILDNGCQNQEILTFLAAIRHYPWINIIRATSNAGIIGGLRLCLEAAKGRYVLPVDSDDLLYPDCLRIVTWWIQQKGFPPLLYTDEDKIIGSRTVQPYLKPDFDPVLLLNSAYIAHLGVIDRNLALERGGYADTNTEGSPDWDLFVRFFVAAQPATHIPEVVYSWRMHPDSTADDAGSKPYIHKSQRAVLQRYLDETGLAKRYDIEYSPLLKHSCDWWLHRRPVDPVPAVLVVLTTGAAPVAPLVDYPYLEKFPLPAEAKVKALAELVTSTAQSENDLVCLVSDDMEIDRPDWLWEAVGLFERFPETVMVGGRIRDGVGSVVSAGLVLGFGRGCDCPDLGRPALDPGYFTQVMKQRSVSAVSSQFAVLRAAMVHELAAESQGTSIPILGPRVGAWARRHGKRVIYSPYLSGSSNINWHALAPGIDMAEFQHSNADLMPDHRFYPAAFETEQGLAYRFKS